MHTAERFFRHSTKLITVHAYVPSDGICRGFAFKYGKFLLPPRFLTALSVPTVPTREQLLSLSHISIKIAFSYSYHDADTIFPVSFIFTASSFRTPCLFLLDRNGRFIQVPPHYLYTNKTPGMLLFILHYSHSISSAFAQKNYIL